MDVYDVPTPRISWTTRLGGYSQELAVAGILAVIALALLMVARLLVG